MRRSWFLSLLLAILIFLILFTIRLSSSNSILPDVTAIEFGGSSDGAIFKDARRNYASTKTLSESAPAGQALGNTQKYEKIASLTEKTSNFEGDRAKMDELIGTHHGVVQFEKSSGLKGRRVAHFAIGVPPDSFDAFVAAVKNIGRNVAVEVVKNDKTNEYLQLKAKRTTLEQARSNLETLQKSGGSIDERLNVQARLTEIEQQIQDLGVSLGEFDSQNELCTVQLTLQEEARAHRSIRARVVDALEWSSIRYFFLGLGLLFFTLGGHLFMTLLRAVLRMASSSKQTGK